MQIPHRRTDRHSFTLLIASLAASLGVSSPVLAQTGAATYYGQGCPAVSATCAGANALLPISARGNQNSLGFAIEVTKTAKARPSAKDV